MARKKLLLACAAACLAFAVAGCSSTGADSDKGDSAEDEARYPVSINGEVYRTDSVEGISALIEENSLVELSADEANYVEADDLVEVVSGEFEGSGYGFANFSFKAKNASSFAVDCLTLDVCLLDENGNIVDTTYPQEQVVVEPGQSIVVDALVDEGAGARVAKVTGYSFWNSDGTIFVTGSVSESPEVALG